MTQGEIEKLAAKTGNIFSKLEVRIMKDIIRRIKENGFVTASADWQISRLKQLGESEQTIKQLIQDALGASDEELERIFSDEVYEQYYGHAHAYELANMQQVPLEKNEALQRTVEAMKEQLRGEYRNLTGSMGFAFRGAGGKLQYSSLANAYRTIMDNAVADITSGAFDYNTVLKRTVSDLTSSGLRWIDYDSGRRDRVDVAARRAVLTGFRQVQGKINEQVAAELQTDMYEVSYHVGARPSHQPWQGRVWSMEQLKSVCGLGSVTGLCGANCYHDYKPFPPGSVRTYTDDQLAEMAKKENATKQYNGREYNTYEALQQQRKMERVMRAQREKIKLLEEGGADPDDIILAKARYQGQMQTYRDFSKKNDKIKVELSEAKIKGIPAINPAKVDVSEFSYDDKHINAERSHGVTRAEAERYIRESDISLTRWNGRFVNYYGPNGATYVDVENKNIRTAFKKEQFDEQVLKIREVVEKYGSRKD